MQTMLLTLIFLAICGFGSSYWYFLYKQTKACEEMKYKACCISETLVKILEKL